LKKYNEKGLLVGPKENEEMFLKRLEKIQSADPSKVFSFLTSGKSKEIPFNPIQEETKRLFHVSIDWLTYFFSNRKLPFWIGGVTWIVSENGVSIPFLQLRKNFLKKQQIAFHSIQEIAIHESLHAARVSFEESKFEEIFAYQGSSKALRRRLGPLFEKTWEASLFLFVILLSSLFSFVSFLFLWLPVVYFGFLSFRLTIRKRQLLGCLKKISQVFTIKNPMWIAFRLTDDEIKQFSSHSLSEINDYIQQNPSLRWKQILASYGKDSLDTL